MRKILSLALTALVFTGALFAANTTPPATTASSATPDKFWPADGKFPVPGNTSSWSGFRQRNVERRTLFAAHRAEDQNAIVFVGDSITEGWSTLKKDFAGLGVKVVNRGIGGDTTPNLVYRLPDDVLSLHPKALVILIGTNDLGEHTAPEQIAANLRDLLQRIRAADPKIPIAWCLVMPRRGDDTYPERIHDLNHRLRKLVANDPLITVVDTFTPLAQPDGTSIPADFVPDRLHLNAAGYAVWHDAVAPVLQSWHLGSN
ncbi:MAG TPA: GDSL-type esterase/lipase family protein [Opitutus sp.]|nr:GDSL-type esterase/lipase family protein [Opitutus sp.]